MVLQEIQNIRIHSLKEFPIHCDKIQYSVETLVREST